MRELTIEEKAKRYDKAIERAKEIYPKWIDEDGKTVAEMFFPELAESEDERIRKGLIGHLKELKEQSVEGSHLKRPEHYDAWIAWLEKQGEQNPVGKIEPKFKVGDWVVYRNDVCQIVKREEGCNKLVTIFGIEKELVNERNLSTARLWTILYIKKY